MLHHPASIRNGLLRSLPAEVLASLQPHLHVVRLPRRAILEESDTRPGAIYFIEEGMAAMLARTQADGQVEVGIIGRSGLIGVPALLGTLRAPYRCQVEVEGTALQIGAPALTHAMEEHDALRHMLMNYVQALLVQNSQTAMCNIRHTLLHRLARWLLLARDRLDSDLIPLTHELLSMMLGVRRAGITAALAQLEVAGALRKSRGTILIADPVELERHACECYRIIADEFARVVEPVVPEPTKSAPAGTCSASSLERLGT
jgi:CRP-like cAMP-binding protein